MKLRQKSKRDQALDAVASMAKTWSEWRLGEKVSKTAAKGAKKAGTAARSAKKSRASSGGAKKRSPLKVAGAIALVGGVGAAVAKKLTGGKAEPLYTPPAPAPDTAPPVVSEGLTQPPTVNEPIAPSPGPAGPAASDTTTPGPRPVSIEDVAGNVAAAEGAAETTLGAEDPGVVPASQQAAPSQEHAPEPEDLISDSAPPEAASGDDDAASVDEATERP